MLDGPYVDLPITAWINDGLGDESLDQERARGNRILAKLLTPAPDGSTWVAAPDLTTGSAAAYGSPASRVDVGFAGGTARSWTWDAASSAYLRAQDGRADLD